MKRTLPILVIMLFLAGIFIAPVGVTHTRTNLQETPLENNVTPEQDAELSWLPPDKTVRVALYNETNITTPDYAHGGMNKNYSIIHPLLVDAGFDVDILTFQNILDHELITANYDVLVLADNCPRENITNLVKDFWLAGGGVLSLDSGISYLSYAGILYRESEGINDGNGVYWDYIWNANATITELHPVTQSYEVGDEIRKKNSDWANVLRTQFDDTTVWDYTTVLAVDPFNSDEIVAVAVDAPDKGGKVVQIGIPVQYWQADWDAMIVDAIDWLAQIPKARIAFDLSHQPRRSLDAWDGGLFPDSYTEIRDSWVSRRFTVDKIHPSSEGNLTAERLENYDVLMIVLPDYNFTNQEVTDLISWVDGGGSLLLLGEAGTSIFNKGNDQLNRILSPMSMQINLDLYTSGTTFTGIDNKHPTSEGVPNGVSIGYRGYINITDDADAICYNNTDIWIAGNTYGNGHVIVQADMNWIGDTQIGDGQNRLLGINMLNWLSMDSPKILVYSDDLYDGGPYRSSVAQVLNEMEIPFYMTVSDLGFNASVNGTWFAQETWDLVILDHCNYYGSAKYDGLLDYLQNGGRAIVNTFVINSYADHPVWAYMGASYSASWTTDATAYIWDNTHGVFNTPIDYGASIMEVHDAGFSDDGDTVTVLDNATALAGITSLEQVGEASIVLRNDGKTLLNSFLLNNMRGDTDESAYLDTLELWFDQIAFMLRPAIDSPADVDYDAGTTGNDITWDCYSIYPSTVTVEQNGTTILSESWTGDDVVISVDGLEAGNYEYTVTVIDIMGYQVQDTVIVTVISTGFSLPIDTNTLIIIILALLGLIIIIVIVKRKKK